MKIVTKVLEGVADIQIFPIIGLIIFFLLFIALVIHVARLSQEEVEEYSNIPLDHDDSSSNVIDSQKP